MIPKEPRHGEFLRTLLLLGAAFFLTATSFFFYHANRSYGHDAGIFAYIGWAMAEGRVLYTQVWENKGPLLYLLNMLGVLLHRGHGIYLLELCSLFIALLFAYKTAKLLTDPWVAFLAAVFASLILCSTLEGGNLSEEFALPFLCVILYYATRFFLQDFSLRWFQICIIGACTGAVFLLRANILAFVAAIAIVLVIALCIRRSFRMLGMVILFVALGFALFLAPFALWLASKGALTECVRVVYLDILGGYLAQGLLTRLQNLVVLFARLQSTGGLYLLLVFSVAFVAAWFSRKLTAPMKCLLSACFLGILLNAWANSISGVVHAHYFITFLPILVVPAAWLLGGLYALLRKQNVPALSGRLLLFALALLLSMNGLVTQANQILHQATERPTETQTQLSAYVQTHTGPEDLVQLAGNGPVLVTLNFREARLSASRYSYYAAGSFNDAAKSAFAEEIAADIMEKQPALVLYTDAAGRQDFLAHLEEPETHAQWMDTHYEKDAVIDGVLIYKKKP